MDFDPGTNVFNMSSSGGYDIFVSKLDNDGNFLWAKSIGTGSQWANSVFVSKEGVLLTGSFKDNADFDPGQDINKLYSSGLSDALVSFLPRMTISFQLSSCSSEDQDL